LTLKDTDLVAADVPLVHDHVKSENIVTSALDFIVLPDVDFVVWPVPDMEPLIFVAPMLLLSVLATAFVTLSVVVVAVELTLYAM
jgi:hypothetical protein